MGPDFLNNNDGVRLTQAARTGHSGRISSTSKIQFYLRASKLYSYGGGLSRELGDAHETCATCPFVQQCRLAGLIIDPLSLTTSTCNTNEVWITTGISCCRYLLPKNTAWVLYTPYIKLWGHYRMNHMQVLPQ